MSFKNETTIYLKRYRSILQKELEKEKQQLIFLETEMANCCGEIAEGKRLLRLVGDELAGRVISRLPSFN